MKKTLLNCVLFGAVCLSPYLSPSVQADIIFTNTQTDDNGTGFGNVLTVLGLQANNSEFGSVLWDGVSDVDMDDATNQSQTRTVAELSAAGITALNMMLIFNINEGGDSNPVLTLNDFDVVFQDATGAELFRETFAAGAGLPLDLAGSGNGASGWLFEVQFTTNAAAAAAFFSVPTNRIGMVVLRTEAISDTKGGADSFFVAARVPEPATIVSALLGAGTLALASIRRRRTRRVA